MQQDKFLKLLDAIAGDHLVRDTLRVLKVIRRLHESTHVEIGRYGFKRGLWARGRHREECGRTSTKVARVGQLLRLVWLPFRRGCFDRGSLWAGLRADEFVKLGRWKGCMRGRQKPQQREGRVSESDRLLGARNAKVELG